MALADRYTSDAQAYAEALQEMTHRCENLTNVLSILRQLDEVDDPTKDLSAICCGILEAVAAGLAAENCSLFLLDEEGKFLTLRATCSPFESGSKYFKPDTESGRTFRLGEGIVGAVARDRQAIRVEDTARDDRFVQFAPPRTEVGSLLCFPLIAGKRLVGVLSLSHSESDFFSAQSEITMSFVAARAAGIFARYLLGERARRSEEYYYLVAENAGDGILVFDRRGRVVSANPAIEALSGIPADQFLSGEVTWESGIHHDDCNLFSKHQKQLFKTKTPDTIQYRWRDTKGKTHHVEHRSSPLLDESGEVTGIVSVARDITERVEAENERRKLEAEVQHVQKLESLGVLAGGIAHDFNNLLVGILGNADLALLETPLESVTRPYLERIAETARRAANLTQEILAYSGKGTRVVEPLDLGKTAQDLGQLLAACVSKTAELRYEIEPDLPLIEGDKAQLQQIVMNLITNASEAIGDKKGVITVGVKRVASDGTAICETDRKDLDERGYVCLQVSDTGCGMDPAVRARVFDPFFSTKFTGRGLGLAAVQGIVHGHKGTIEVRTEPGQGTTFTILFPAVAEGAVVEKESPLSEDEDLLRWRGHGTLLIVDDEEPVRDVARMVAEDRGLAVLTAENGLKGVEVFQARSGDISLVLLDLTMPVMGGTEVFRRIQDIRPDIPVIFSSGYTEQDLAKQFVDKAPTMFIQKPYTPLRLVAAMRQALGA